MTVRLGKYKNLGIEKTSIEVTDAEIQKAIDDLLEKFKIEVEKDGFIANGDNIIIDYDCYHEGEHVADISRKNHHFKIGEGFFLEEIEKELLDKKTGDEIEVKAVVGKDSPVKYLRGEEVTFNVTVSVITNRIMPELNDETVRNCKIDGISTVDELINLVKHKLIEEKKYIEGTSLVNEIAKLVIDDSEVVLDEDEVGALKKEIYDDFIETIKQNGANLSIYLSYTKKTEQEVEEKCLEEAKVYLTEKLILEKIAEVENIKLTSEEISLVEKDDDKGQLLYEKIMMFLLRENTVIKV